MKTNKLYILVFIGLLLLPALACGGSFSTANIKSAILTTDSEGTQETTTFAPDQIFYCIVELANAPEDTTLKAAWTAVAVTGEEPNVLIDENELTAGANNIFTFNLSNDQPWPAGKYKVDLYLNGELDRTLEFEVQ